MTKDEIAARLKNRYGSELEVLETTQPEAYIYISKEKYHDCCRFLRDDSELDFDFVFQLAGVHYPDECFEIVICLSSYSKIHKMVLKVKLDKDNPVVETATDIWMGANWYEREAMELFGIKFLNHPDPRPLLLDDDWDNGYPMRKGWTGPDFIPMPEK